MATLRGGRVIGTTSTAEKGEIARKAGAKDVLRYDGFTERVRALTGDVGVAAVYDSVGADTFEGSLRSLCIRGVLVCVGNASGYPPPVDMRRMVQAGSCYVTWPVLQDHMQPREDLLARAAEVFGWISTGKLDVHIHRTYPLEEARHALEELSSRASAGKLLLRVR
jgi:NADPH2:quinone reductase